MYWKKLSKILFTFKKKIYIICIVIIKKALILRYVAFYLFILLLYVGRQSNRIYVNNAANLRIHFY